MTPRKERNPRFREERKAPSPQPIPRPPKRKVAQDLMLRFDALINPKTHEPIPPWTPSYPPSPLPPPSQSDLHHNLQWNHQNLPTQGTYLFQLRGTLHQLHIHTSSLQASAPQGHLKSKGPHPPHSHPDVASRLKPLKRSSPHQLKQPFSGLPTFHLKIAIPFKQLPSLTPLPSLLSV